ncbi:uncharacterized protein LOC133793779 [Humulus lupulus]|uniref:uncharacterized protein LOC133793779 n=1 Tax=Humulus lupulus TaxID=3486 RepID=UPI002B412E40|nr:uncharacterized protein LOC133793779 [Humulus lupulus]
MKKKFTSYWDSMKTGHSKMHRIHLLSGMLNKLDDLLLSSMDDVYVGRLVFKVFGIVPAPPLPQQDNGHDCGIFVMHYMECIVFGQSPRTTYKVDHSERFRLAVNILTSESNRLCWKAARDAADYYNTCLSERSPSLKKGVCLPQVIHLPFPCIQRKREEANPGLTLVRERKSHE